MFPKYVFHRESEEELKEFLQVATELQQNPEQCVAINAYLNELQSQRPQTTESPKNSAQIENEEVTTTATQNIELTQNENAMEVSQFNFSVSADHTEIIIESLLKEKTISKSDFEKLVSDCDEGQIESVILAVKGKLDVKTVCDFGVALCTYENEESGVVFRYFYEHILFPLLSVEQSTAFQEMFCGVYKKFYRLIKIEDVVKRLFCCGVFLQNISKLDAEFKNEILRNVVLNCRQLDENYVKVLECLLDKNTHHSVIKMIVVFLASQGETKDKALGKLLVSLIQILGRNIHQFEQPLRQIIAHHKSVWRTKIQKTFNEHYECSQSSQSLIKTNV